MKTAAAADTIPDDVVLEILFRVSTDSADLLRCAATCKRWCALIADESFLGRRWPEKACHPLSLLGFFVQQRELGMVDIYSQPPPPFFVPVQAMQPPTPLGGARRRRFLTGGVPAGLLDGATPLTARCGLLLVHLAAGDSDIDGSVHLALCDPLAGTCDVLPPLKCPFSSISCAILTASDYCSSSSQQQRRSTTQAGYSTFFTLPMVVDYAYDYWHDCNLYTFSSAKPSWSTPRRCFNTRRSYHNGGFVMPLWNRSGVVCRGITHWLCIESPSKYYTFNVGIETGDISLTELSIPVDQLSTRDYYGWPMLGVAVDGKTLNLFYLHRTEAGLPQLHIWTRRARWEQDNDDVRSETDDETFFWLRVGTFDLTHTTHGLIRVWSGEKSGALFIFYKSTWRVHRLDVQTGVMEEMTGFLCDNAMPMEIDWPAFFMSRLCGHVC